MCVCFVGGKGVGGGGGEGEVIQTSFNSEFHFLGDFFDKLGLGCVCGLRGLRGILYLP